MFGRSRISRKKDKKRSSWRAIRSFVWIASVAFLLVGLVYALWYVTRLPRFSIDSIEVSGGDTIPETEIERVARQELFGEHFRLVPKRFVWWYPEEEIVVAIKAVPRVKDVSIERKGNTLDIIFSEYRPYALWCDRTTLESSGVNKSCSFIDAEGVAFAPAPALSGSAFLRFVSDREPSLGERGFEPYLIEQGASFVDMISERFGFAVAYLEKVNETELFCHLVGGALIKIDTERDIRETIQNLAVVLGETKFSHLRAGSFSYIDLRYGNKVFVNEAGEGEESLNAASSSEAAL